VSFFSRFIPRKARAQSVRIQRRKRHELDRMSALQVARDIELNNPELVVAGVRVIRRAGKALWTIDVVNRSNGRMASLDDHDDWTRRLQEILPDRSTADARVVGRQVARV